MSLNMDAADMTTPDFVHHDNALHGPMSASNFDMTSSLFANPAFNYPTQYTSIDLGYDLGLGYGGYNVAIGANASPQQIFGHHTPAYSEGTLYSQGLHHVMSVHSTQRSPTIKIEVVSQDSDHVKFQSQELQHFKLTPAAKDNAVGTDVDSLMRAIQTKVKKSMPQPHPSIASDSSSDSASSDSSSPSVRNTDRRCSKARRRYPCKMPACTKVFTQKTHLEIHTRAHTGYKPYVRYPQQYQVSAYAYGCLEQLCRETSCGQRFSQLGNLKVSPTHSTYLGGY